jgi:hypothetical protein
MLRMAQTGRQARAAGSALIYTSSTVIKGQAPGKIISGFPMPSIAASARMTKPPMPTRRPAFTRPDVNALACLYQIYFQLWFRGTP